jgi:hypothetical protein
MTKDAHPDLELGLGHQCHSERSRGISRYFLSEVNKRDVSTSLDTTRKQPFNEGSQALKSVAVELTDGGGKLAVTSL